jgi:4-amino-4-deoxy-L-arabinose transferase-like glycosyltransferase
MHTPHLDGTLSAYRSPLYPVFLGIVYVFAGELNYRAVYLVQSVLSLVTIISIYTIARRLFNPRAGWMAASIAAMYPPFVLFNITTMTESVSLVLATLALALLLKVRSNTTRVILVILSANGICENRGHWPGLLLAINHQATKPKPAEAGCPRAIYRPLAFQPDDKSSGGQAAESPSAVMHFHKTKVRSV